MEMKISCPSFCEISSEIFGLSVSAEIESCGNSVGSVDDLVLRFSVLTLVF